MTPSLRFRVENLGPIRHGEVELRPLTLLIGKNNTGKTYMAQVVHAAHKTVRTPISPSLTPRLSETDVATLQSLVLADQPPTAIVLPECVAKNAPTWILKLLKHSSEELVGEIKAYFNISRIEELKSWEQDKCTQIEIRECGTDSSLLVFGISDQSPEVNDKRINLDASAINRLYFSLHWIMTHYDPSSLDQSIAETERIRDLMLSLSTDAVIRSLWQTYLDSLGFANNSCYLPSGRSGLLAASTEVIRSRLQNHRAQFGEDRMSDFLLGSVHSDFLSSLQLLLDPTGSPKRADSDIESMTPALACVNEAMAGSVTVQTDASDIPRLIYEQSGNALPIIRTSAMVADLTPIALWLQGLVRPGDLLIIDEPESHLHPEAIRLLARALVRLANAGVKVLCTTHSSVLLHQISNCMLSSPAPDVDTDLSEEDGIDHSKIGVFRFHHDLDTEGVTISPVKIDPDWGIPEDEYVDIADELTNQTAGLIDARSK